MNRIALVTCSLVALAGVALWPTSALSAPDSVVGPVPQVVTRWLVVQPGYPGSTDDATGFMDLFSRYLAKKTALPGVRGTYHNLPEDALAAMRASFTPAGR